VTVRTLVAATPGLPLEGGSYLRLEAIDPTTGAAVTGVTVSDVAVYGRVLLDGEAQFIEVLPARLIPGPGA
jgi:hypothetical protein